jgi:CheY-like chemotaxis protein
VVDDDHDNAQMMKVLCRAEGYEAKLAFSGREAIEAARTLRPHVMLIDLSLPDMSGAEVAEKLRGTAGFEATTFVAVSGYDEDRTSPVFEAHFTKPVDHEALLGFLSKWKADTARSQNDGITSPPGTEET